MDERKLKDTSNKLRMALDAENPDQAIVDALLDDGENIMAAIWHEITENDMMICGIDNHLSIMQDRKQRCKNRIEKLRAAMLFFLQRSNQKSFKHDLFTASLKETPDNLVIDDEAAIPSEYFKVGEPKLDKKELKDSLKQGEAIEGARLEEGKYTVQIRSK